MHVRTGRTRGDLIPRTTAIVAMIQRTTIPARYLPALRDVSPPRFPTHATASFSLFVLRGNTRIFYCRLQYHLSCCIFSYFNLQMQSYFALNSLNLIREANEY